MLTFADPLRRALQIAADRPAILDGDQLFTYRQFNARCERLAGALYASGLAAGDRVAILAANGHAYLETYVGVPACGLVVVPLNTRHAEPELEYAIEDSGTKVLITDRDPGGLADRVERVIRLGADYEAFLAGATPMPLGAGLTETTLAGLFYTGGTTGKSKGVMLSHRNLIANTYHWMSAAPQDDTDVSLVMAPLFHAAGSNGVLASIWTGGVQVTLAAFDAASALDLIQQHKVTLTLGVPTMLSAIAEEQFARPRSIDSVRLIAHGGSPIATEVVRRTHLAFPAAELVHVYGATELSPLTTVLRHEQNWLEHDRARSCGQSIVGSEVRILGADGAERATGEVGEVVVRGPHVMMGYWNKAEQTAAVLKEGAYWTGDLGYMDAGGYVFLVDRSKDMIVSGGENVYCTEVEEVLYQHPAVLEAAAFGVPDARWGEAVHATVVPRPEHGSVDPADIIAFCRQRIAGYKVPKTIDIRSDPLPKSGPGKILKRELRAPFWEGRDRRVN
ncbi:MAG: AMP-binding protein [Pseudomonadales bacterium]|nr:AMP-binding protein [Pseudomonadales bacterium]MCP5185515.1 AMP-binding protein [Pseudomonadales bacterium]